MVSALAPQQPDLVGPARQLTPSGGRYLPSKTCLITVELIAMHEHQSPYVCGGMATPEIRSRDQAEDERDPPSRVAGVRMR